jgi:glucose-6-phosphate dehydrogenase assembly protein OpcA
MPTNYKVLGQSAPAATTDTTLYTVPSATEAVVSTIVVANRAPTTDASYRIAIRPNGATLANQHYIAYDVTVGAGDSTTLTLGITLDATDIITVRGSTADLSFNAFGSEVTP